MADVTLCKLELLCSDGWWTAHHGVNLLHPERYCERLAAKGKYGRVTVLDANLAPKGTVYTTPGAPAHLAGKVSSHGKVPLYSSTPKQEAPAPTVDLCDVCEEFHLPPFDGSCLL